MTCGDHFPGAQAWTCSETDGHHGPHRNGCVAWSSQGSQVGDGKHDDEQVDQ